MGQDFLTLDNVGNFTFQLFAVVAATEFTKRFINKIYRLRNKENKCETEFIVLGHSLVLSIIKTFSDNEISWCGSCEGFINILLVLMNAFIISYLSIASYSKILENKTSNEPKCNM